MRFQQKLKLIDFDIIKISKVIPGFWDLISTLGDPEKPNDRNPEIDLEVKVKSEVLSEFLRFCHKLFWGARW